jgi:putative endonuclease
MLWLAEALICFLQKLSPAKATASHIALGRRGETAAYFYLRRLGYRFVATNFRVPHNRCEIDLIGWDQNVLCFIEVKTRTDDSFAPPSTAVTLEKQDHIRSVARAYVRRLPRAQPPACRFDIVSVVPSPDGGRPSVSLRKGAFSWKTPQRRTDRYTSYFERRFQRRRS